MQDFFSSLQIGEKIKRNTELSLIFLFYFCLLPIPELLDNLFCVYTKGVFASRKN